MSNQSIQMRIKTKCESEMSCQSESAIRVFQLPCKKVLDGNFLMQVLPILFAVVLGTDVALLDRQ